MLKKTTLTATILLNLTVSACFAGDEIHAVGSSTVYPFVTVAAEEFGKNGSFKTPIIESTGTGGGFKLFCAGTGTDTPTLVNASRAIKDSEKALCQKNGVTTISEFKIGYDGIVLAHSKKSPELAISLHDLFLALARKVPHNGALVDNPYTTWKEINPSLPANNIEVYGPPPTSGTRDAFVELVMEKACAGFKEFTTAFPKEEDRKKACGALREDGKFIESGENDNLVVQKLIKNTNAVGIFGYSYLEENSDALKGAPVDNSLPSFNNIAQGKYPISRPLFVYVKNAHIGKTPGIKEFILELTSENAIGKDGYLLAKGLIPLQDAEQKTVQKAAESLK